MRENTVNLPLDILRNIKTDNDIKTAYSELDKLSEMTFTKEPKVILNDSIDTIDIDDLLGKANKYLRIININDLNYFAKTEEIKLDSRSNFQTVISKLKEYLKNIKKMSVFVSIEPRGSIINKINEFIRSKIGKIILIDFILDEKLIGGAKLNYNGLYRDYSIKRELDTRFTLSESKESKKAQDTSAVILDTSKNQ